MNTSLYYSREGKRGADRGRPDKGMKTIINLSYWLRTRVVTKIIKLNNKVACRQSKKDLIISELPILDEKSFPEPGELSTLLTLIKTIYFK